MEEEDTREVLLPNWKGSGSMGLTLDQNDDGVFVKQLVENSPAAKTGVVKEGDQIVGATVYFDNMSSEDIQKVLATVGHHTVGLKLQRKGDRSPLPGATFSHDVFSLKSPDVVLSGDDEEYRRIYAKKIKPRLKSDETLEPETQTRTITVTRKVTAYTVDVTGTKDSKEIDISSPDYKIKIPRHEITEISKTSVQTDEGKTVIRIPGIDVSSKYQAGREYLPSDSVNVHSNTVRYHEHGKGQIEFPERYSDAAGSVHPGSTSSLSINLPGVNVSTPKFQSYEKKFEMRTSRIETEHDDRFKDLNVAGSSSVDIGLTNPNIARVPKQDTASITSKLDFQSSGVKIRGPQFDIKKAEGIKMEAAALSEIPANIATKETHSSTITGDINTHGKNRLPLDTSCGSVKIGLPSFQMPKSGSLESKLDRTYTQTTLIQDGNVHEKPQLNLIPPSVEGEATTGKISLNVPSLDVKGTDVNLDSSGGKIHIPSFKMSKFGVLGTNEGTSETGIELSGKSVYTNTTEGKTSVKPPGIDGFKLEKDFQSSAVGITNSQAASTNINIKGHHLGLQETVNLPNESLEFKGALSDTVLKGSEVNITMPKFKMPKFGIAESNLQGPGVDVNITKQNINLSGTDLDMNIGNLSSDLKGPSLKIESIKSNLPKVSVPDIGANIKGPKIGGTERSEGKLKGPNCEKPRVDINLPKVSMPDVDLRFKHSKAEGDLKDARLDVKGPNIELQGPGIGVDGKMGGSKFGVPSVQLSSMSVPEIDLKGSKRESDLKEPDFIIKGPELDARMPVVNLDASDVSLEGKIQMPKFKMPKFGHSKPQVEGPNVDLPTGNVGLPGANIDINVPEFNIKDPEGKLKGPKFDMPSLDIGLPKVSVADTDHHVKGPKLEGNLKGSKGTEVDFEAPDVDIDGKVKGPKFKLPSMPKMSTPDIEFNMKGPKVERDWKGPKANIKAPELGIEAPQVELESPDVDLKGSEGKLKMPKYKMPKFGVSGSTGEGPDIDTSFPKGSIDISGPSMDIQAPNVDLKGPEGKLKSPIFKMPSMNVGLPKVSMPDADLSLKGPKIEGDFKGPKVDNTCPKVDLEAPDIDIDGKVKGSKFKLPSMPKMSMPDFDLNLKDPKIEGDLKGPEGNIKGPEVVLEAPNVDIDGKVKGSKFKLPSLHMGEMSMPDIDLNLKGPKIGGFKVPKADIKAPELNVEAPGVEIDAADVNLKGPEGKFKMPKFKMPTFGGSGLKMEGPDIDTSLPKGSIDLSGPNVDIQAPDVDIEVPKGKLKGPKFQMPSMNIGLPKVTMPDFDLNLKGPKLEGDLKGPEVNIKGPKVDLEAPDVDINGKVKGSKFQLPSMPKMSMPDFDLNLKGPKIEGDLKGPKGNIKGPEVDLEAPDVDIDGKVKGPKFKLPSLHMGEMSMPDIDLNLKGPKLGGFKGPKADIKAPDLDVEVPGVEIDTPDVNLKGPEGKFKMPKFKMPTFGFSDPKMEGPDIDASLPKGSIDISGPNVNIADPEGRLKGFKVSIPSTDVRLPKASMPDINVKTPKIKGEADLSTSKLEGDLGLKAPHFKGDIRAPKLEGKLEGPGIDLSTGGVSVESPDLTVKTPTLDIEGPEGNLKLPKVKKPKFGFGIKSPKADMKSPSVDVNAPDVEFDSEVPELDVGGKGKKGKFKMPKIHMSGPKIKGKKGGFDVSAPEVDSDINLNAPDADLNVAGGDAAISTNLGIKAPKTRKPFFGKMNFPDVEFDLKSPKLKGETSLQSPSVELKTPDLDISGGFKTPEAELTSSRASIEGPDVKVKKPKFKFPNFSMSSPKVEVTAPDTGVSLPKVEADLSGPKIATDIKVPSVDLMHGTINISSEVPAAETSVPGIDVNLKGPKIKSDMLTSGSMQFQAPKVGIPGSGGKIKLPTVDISSPKASDSEFDINLKGPKIESNLDISGGVKPTIGTKSLDSHITVPSLDLSGSYLQGHKLPTGEISLSGPDVGHANVSGKIENSDLGIKGPSFQSSAVVKGSAPGINISMKDSKIKEGISIGQSINLTGDMQGSEGFEVGPKMKGGMTGPKVKGSLDVQGIGGNLESSDVKITFPRLLMPKFTSSGPDLAGREVGVDVDFPSADVLVKKSGETGLEIDESEIKIKKSKIKMPKLNFKSKAKEDVSLSNVSVSGSKGDFKSPKASLGSAEGGLVSTNLDMEKAPKYEFSLFTNKKTTQRSSSFSEEKDESTHSSPSGTLEAGSSLSAEGGKKKGKQSKIKFGTFGGLGSKSKGSYEVTLSDDENVQGSGASISSRKSRVSSSSSNDSATKAGVRLPKLELTVAKKKE